MVGMLGYVRALLSYTADYVKRNMVWGHSQDSDDSQCSQLTVTNASTKQVQTIRNKSYSSALSTEVFQTRKFSGFIKVSFTLNQIYRSCCFVLDRALLGNFFDRRVRWVGLPNFYWGCQLMAQDLMIHLSLRQGRCLDLLFNNAASTKARVFFNR